MSKYQYAPLFQIRSLIILYTSYTYTITTYKNIAICVLSTLELDTIICGDCLEVMPQIPDKSIDIVLADLPYGVTACKWDTPLPLDDLWHEWLRICTGAIVLTGTQPFTTTLIMSRPDLFKYEWIWEKTKTSNFMNANKMPLKFHENILVFYKKLPTYNPIKREGAPHKSNRVSFKMPKTYGTNQERTRDTKFNNEGLLFPSTVLKIASVDTRHNILLSTQKPVALFEYLIRTYTNEGDTVLDPTAGSGTTAVACRKSNRHYICIEKEQEYVDIANKRLSEML